jgi:hypothetical protein
MRVRSALGASRVDPEYVFRNSLVPARPGNAFLNAAKGVSVREHPLHLGPDTSPLR